jgi:CheY-like chemotaxis protein
MSNVKTSLLVVDDESSTRTLLSQVFGQLGYSVRAAEDGFQALEQIREELPDILLSDLNMPGMSGFELLSVIRRRIPNIYVIASSGAFSGREVPNGIAADAFHEKGTGMQNLLGLVKKAGGDKSQPRAGSSASLPISSASLPIWIAHARVDDGDGAYVLITCPECLRAFSMAVGAADFVIHQANCAFCSTTIHYATVQPMNPQLPHQFRTHGDAPPKAGASAA